MARPSPAQMHYARERRLGLAGVPNLFRTHRVAIPTATVAAASFTVRTTPVTFATAITITENSGTHRGLIFELGDATTAIAAWVDDDKIVFRAGGATASTRAVATFTTGTGELPVGRTFRLVFSVRPALGTVRMWIDGLEAARGQAVTFPFSAGWAASSNGAFAAAATGTLPSDVTRTGAPDGFTVVQPLSVYVGQHPQHFGTERDANPFNPIDLEPTYWFESQDNASFTLLSENVTGWVDLAGGPTLVAINMTNPRVDVGGFQMITFNGTNQLFVASADNAAHKFADGDFSLFHVSRAGDANRGNVVAKQATTPGYFFRYNNADSSDGDFVAFIRDAAADSAIVTMTDIVHNDDTVRIMGMIREGNLLSFYRDGAVVGTADATAVGDIDTTNPLCIGAQQGAAGTGSGATQFLAGEIGEVIAVKRALSAQELTNLHAFLDTKWGL